MFEWLTDPHVWASFIALSAMEIVLGIDNVVFISVMVSRMAPEQRLMARRIGLSLALVFRVIMLAGIAWFIHLTTPIFSIGGYHFSWRDLVLIAGGLFLLVKGTREMHQDIEGEHDESGTSRVADTLTSAIIQIAVIDLVFSIDSIVTAVGMADHVEVMIAAVIVAVGIMFVASGPVARFVAEHPTTKMLALAFLLLIGVSLVADGLGFHIPKGYIYAAMGFSVLVEAINILAKERRRTRQAKRAATSQLAEVLEGAEAALSPKPGSR